MFTHKSGIHADGVLKNPSLYEAFDPVKLGMTRRISVGKHSGKASIRHRLEQIGLASSPGLLEAMRLEVTRMVELKKADLTDDDLATLHASLAKAYAPSRS
jgi:homocitrate synthase NifV